MLERIDRYELRERIGAGGQATVYLGHDTLLDRTVAVKVMNQLVSSQPEYVDGLMSEAQLAAGLSHQNIATVYDFKIDGDYASIIMEYVPNSLDKELQRGGAMPTAKAVEITIQICDGLAYAHSMGFVHRDIKPHNILLASDGSPKITDFGIARATDLSSVSAVGTPLYMSPEQCRGDESPDIRSDIYSAGVMLYEMLAGHPPYQGTAMQLPQMHLNDPTPDFPSSVHVPPNLTAIVRKCMEKDPENRYQNAQEVASALGALSEAPARGARGAAPMGQQVMAEPDEPEPTGRDWRRQGRYTVVGEIGKDDRQGFTRNVQAGADEVVIVRKNGEIEDVFSEQRKPTRSFGESILSLLGLGPNIEVYKATKTRFNIVFWLGDDDTAATGHKSFAFGLPVLTSDNQVIPARINLWIEVDEELAENALLLLRGKNVLNRYDIASEIRDDLHAKVLGLDLNQHTFEELRGNRPLLREIGESIQREITGTLGAFGLRIQDYSISWGLTLQERAEIDQQRHQVSLEQVRNINEIGRISVPTEQPQQGLGNAVEVILRPSVWTKAVAIMSLIAAVVFFAINSSRILEQAGSILGIQPETVGRSLGPGVVPTVVSDTGGIKTIPLIAKPAGGYQAVIPITEVADLLHIGRLDFASEIPPDATVSVEPISINAAPPPPEKALFVRAVDITLSGAGDTTSIPGTIEFQVMMQWLDEQSVSLDDVTLFRHNDGWTELETSHLSSVVGSENQFYERFSAETPGFSIFAVGIKYDKPVLPLVSETVIPVVPTQKPLAIPAPTTSSADTMVSTAGKKKFSYGVSWIEENAQFVLGDLGIIKFIIARSYDPDRVIIYGSGHEIGREEDIRFAQTVTSRDNECLQEEFRSDGSLAGYDELEGGGLNDLSDASEMVWENQDSIFLGTADSDCYRGVLFLNVGDVYAAIDPVMLEGQRLEGEQTMQMTPGRLGVSWYVGVPGQTDFSDVTYITHEEVRGLLGENVDISASPDTGFYESSTGIATSEYLDIINHGVHELGSDENGVHYGTAVISAGEYFDVGTGPIMYSFDLARMDGAGYGYFRGSDDVKFANLVPMEENKCGSGYVGYEGVDITDENLRLDELYLDRINSLDNRDREDKSLKFGTLLTACYTGVIVYEQNGVFGAIDPFFMHVNGDLVIRWWSGARADNGFVDAPGDLVMSPALRSAVGGGSALSVDHVEFLSESEFAGASWEDLGGIHLLSNLRILQIHGGLGFEDDLDGFAELLEHSHVLDTIDLRARGIRDLDPITRIPPLRKLTLTFGRISDISPLQDQPSLEYINLDGNEITDISPLLNMPNLRQVILVSNPLSEESRNSHLPELRSRGVIVAAD